MIALFMVGDFTEVQAQRHDKEDKYWEHRKEADKKRVKFRRVLRLGEAIILAWN